LPREGSALLKSDFFQIEDSLLGILAVQLFLDQTDFPLADFGFHLPKNVKNHRWGEPQV
jgi:hypothetical protein